MSWFLNVFMTIDNMHAYSWDQVTWQLNQIKELITTHQFFLSASLHSEFSFSYASCQTKAKEPTLPNDLLIDGEGRIDGFMLFPVM